MKNKFLIAVVISVIFFSGCSIFDRFKKDATDLVEDGKKSYENIAEEVHEVKSTLNQTKEKIEETVDDIQTAVVKVNEAKESLKEIAK